MGAKQSKRSVDISGKEAESAGEVAAAGAGGEGRVEQIDADALKPQLNGDAHIHEQTEKEKQLDSGTPENEKDATTEKESKEQEPENEDKGETPITNGENTPPAENGESAPTPEDTKKPKKEKVKKKWSLRSISFSRKDKPKQEKKQKEEEAKTNGEPEKVPEETAEVAPEVVKEVVEEVKVETEAKDEKTPETPVTEPITNGSSTPETPKVESPASEAPAITPHEDRPEAKADPEPEHLPVNGLSLEEPEKDAPAVDKCEESKPEEPAVETTETVPAPEIPVKKEVCVEQMPLIEPTPPPLPANPPPSSVASFAVTTMAPEMNDASLANSADTVISAQPAIPDIKDMCDEVPPHLPNALIDTVATEVHNSVEEIKEGNFEQEPVIVQLNPEVPVLKTEPNMSSKEVLIENVEAADNADENINVEMTPEIKPVEEIIETPVEASTHEPEENKELPEESSPVEELPPVITPIKDELLSEPLAVAEVIPPETIPVAKELPPFEEIITTTEEIRPLTVPLAEELPPVTIPVVGELPSVAALPVTEELPPLALPVTEELSHVALPVAEELPPMPLPEAEELSPVTLLDTEDLPPPPLSLVEHVPVDTITTDENEHSQEVERYQIDETIVNANHISSAVDLNGVEEDESQNGNDDERQNIKNKLEGADVQLRNVIETECNGNIEEVKDSAVKTLLQNTEEASGDVEVSLQAPPELPSSPSLQEAPEKLTADPKAALALPSQEPLTVSDKMVELIPEIPVVPELKTEMETPTDVAVAN